MCMAIGENIGKSCPTLATCLFSDPSQAKTITALATASSLHNKVVFTFVKRKKHTGSWENKRRVRKSRAEDK